MFLIITALVRGRGRPPPTLLPEAINSAVEFTPIGQLNDAIHSPWRGVDVDVTALLSLAGIAVAIAVVAHRRLSRLNVG